MRDTIVISRASAVLVQFGNHTPFAETGSPTALLGDGICSINGKWDYNYNNT